MAERFSLIERILNRIDRARRPPAGRARSRVVRRFHRLYYMTSRRTWRNTFFLGVPIAKCPLDLWVYQEIINEVRPDLIVETGTAHGGSALYMATLCDLVGRGRVVSVDIVARAGLPQHPRVNYVVGSSVAPETFEQVREQLRPGETVLVHAGGSGIGTTAIKMAKAIGCTVYTTVGSDESPAFAAHVL